MIGLTASEPPIYTHLAATHPAFPDWPLDNGTDERGSKEKATRNSEVQMPRARSVLLILFLLAGSLSPPAVGAQGSSPPARQVPTGPAPPPPVTLEQNYP